MRELAQINSICKKKTGEMYQTELSKSQKGSVCSKLLLQLTVKASNCYYGVVLISQTTGLGLQCFNCFYFRHILIHRSEISKPYTGLDALGFAQTLYTHQNSEEAGTSQIKWERLFCNDFSCDTTTSQGQNKKCEQNTALLRAFKRPSSGLSSQQFIFSKWFHLQIVWWTACISAIKLHLFLCLSCFCPGLKLNMFLNQTIKVCCRVKSAQCFPVILVHV